MNDSFAVFILTHGRAKKVKTYESLIKQGYTGKIYLIIDDEDEQGDMYMDEFGDKVIVFNKKDIAERFDQGDYSDKRNTIFYARNACFEIAEELGIRYFMQLDDDYDRFSYKFNNDLVYQKRDILNLDDIFKAMVEYYKSIDALSICMSQNGDFIGGKRSGYAKEIKATRKAMNTFLCSTDRKFAFLGRINEDVNTYVNLGRKGKLFLTLSMLSINQGSTQKNKGGMTDIYLDSGTYLKSFFSVMYNPSCVKISEMGARFKRIHHKVCWNSAAPRIISERYKKYE